MNRKHLIQWSLVGLGCLALANPLQAKPKKDSQENWVESVTGVDVSKQKKKKNQSDASDWVSGIVPSNQGRGKKDSGNIDPWQSIRDYIFGYQKQSKSGKGLPPGLAKKTARGGQLPPGWQKKVQPGSIFPNDLWSYASPINYSQVPGLRQPKSGVDYYSIGNRILKMNQSDRRILDVMDFD